jgi:hypothetical protein
MLFQEMGGGILIIRCLLEFSLCCYLPSFFISGCNNKVTSCAEIF